MLSHRTARLLEEAADELARLDSLSESLPAAVRHAQRAANIALLAQASPEARGALVAAECDSLHAAALPSELGEWRDKLDETERRARSGLPLVPGRLPDQAAIRDEEALREALRPGGAARSVLLRAVTASAALEAGALAQLVPAALLCSGGLFGGIRLLPFAAMDAERRGETLAQWQRADPEPFTDAALETCTLAAREQRLRLRDCRRQWEQEDTLLEPLGRAAITPRRALAQLHERLAITMPALAEALECSRPAAGAALDRLVDAGLAEELTGRGRDRVYAWAPAWALHGP